MILPNSSVPGQQNAADQTNSERIAAVFGFKCIERYDPAFEDWICDQTITLEA